MYGLIGHVRPWIGGWQRAAGYPFVIWGICMGAYWLFTHKGSE